MKNLDHAEKILYLCLIIKSLCEENNLNKDVIIEDFIDLMNQKNKKPPKNYSKGAIIET